MASKFKNKIFELEQRYNTETDYHKKLQIRHIIDSAKSKYRKHITAEKKKNKIKKIVQNINQPPIRNSLIMWETDSAYANNVIGFFNNKKIFEIKRGVLSFSMKITNKMLIHEKFIKSYNSVDLIKLQKTANKILKESISSPSS